MAGPPYADELDRARRASRNPGSSRARPSPGGGRRRASEHDSGRERSDAPEGRAHDAGSVAMQGVQTIPGAARRAFRYAEDLDAFTSHGIAAARRALGGPTRACRARQVGISVEELDRQADRR